MGMGSMMRGGGHDDLGFDIALRIDELINALPKPKEEWINNEPYTHDILPCTRMADAKDRDDGTGGQVLAAPPMSHKVEVGAHRPRSSPGRTVYHRHILIMKMLA